MYHYFFHCCTLLPELPSANVRMTSSAGLATAEPAVVIEAVPRLGAEMTGREPTDVKRIAANDAPTASAAVDPPRR